MKNTSIEFIAKDEAAQRQPVELYHIQHVDSNWYYTSGDVSVDFDSKIWEPAIIQRGTVSYDANLEGTKVAIKLSKSNPAVAIYLMQTPLSLASITIYKLFREQDPFESSMLFTGVIVGVSLKGISVQADCMGMDYIINHHALKQRYQPECNHTVFSTECGLVEAAWELTTTVTVDSTGSELTSNNFAAQADGWWTLGIAQYGDEQRLIVSHVADKIVVMTPFQDLITGETVVVLPGCAGDIDTCKDKFNNLTHFFGFPFIPIDNPVFWFNK